MRVILVVVAILTVACQRTPDAHIDPEFQPYYDSFKAAAVEVGTPTPNQPVTIVMVPTLKGLDGQCYVKQGLPTIEISSEFWKGQIGMRMDLTPGDEYIQHWGESVKTFLIWHELGHCLLNRSHSASRESIMWPHAGEIDVEDFDQNRTAFLKELFGRG